MMCNAFGRVLKYTTPCCYQRNDFRFANWIRMLKTTFCNFYRTLRLNQNVGKTGDSIWKKFHSIWNEFNRHWIERSIECVQRCGSFRKQPQNQAAACRPSLLFFPTIVSECSSKMDFISFNERPSTPLFVCQQSRCHRDSMNEALRLWRTIALCLHSGHPSVFFVVERNRCTLSLLTRVHKFCAAVRDRGEFGLFSPSFSRHVFNFGLTCGEWLDIIWVRDHCARIDGVHINFVHINIEMRWSWIY